MRWAIVGTLGVALAGCGSRTASTTVRSVPKVVAADPWVLTTVDASATEPALLWNGQIGVRIGRDGTGGIDGNPLPFFAIDLYQTSGEEKILPLTGALPSALTVEGERIKPLAAGYRQSLDMRTGRLVTEYDADTKIGTVHVQVDAAISPTRREVAERFSLHLPKAGKVELVYSPPTGIDEVAQSTHGETSAKADVPADVKLDRVFGLGQKGEMGAVKQLQTYEEIEKDSARAWAERWKTDIEVDGPVADQQAVRSFLFYLRSAIAPEGKMSISPFGLSNAQYNGHVFWDADIWVFPALALIDPNSAKAIPSYRLARIDAEPRNPSIGDKAIPMLKYAWESSVSGRETVPGPSQKELHITGSVMWGMNQAVALGLIDPQAFANLAPKADAFYYVGVGKEGDGREIHDVMSPDENHVGNNDLYTNLLANWLHNKPWQPTHREQLWYKLPHDDKTFLTYDNDPLKGYKQAAAVLSIYPLQYPPAEKQARAMMDRFADKVIKNGPAMTDSIHSVIWSRLGEKAKAYDAWQASWRPFTQGPLMLFSEKRTKPNTYFTTGAAGSLQSVLFGFLGFRIDYKKEPGAAWATKLQNGMWLSVQPHLPTQWKSVKFKNFTVLGRRYTLTTSSAATTVSPGE